MKHTIRVICQDKRPSILESTPRSTIQIVGLHYNGDASSAILQRYILLRVIDNCNLDKHHLVVNSAVDTAELKKHMHQSVNALLLFVLDFLDFVETVIARNGVDGVDVVVLAPKNDNRNTHPFQD